MTSPPRTIGLGRRLAVIFYDGLLLVAVLYFATVPAILLNDHHAIPSGSPGFSLYLLLVSFVYYGWFWTHGGQTLGMRVWRCYVVTNQGERLGWTAAAIRFGLALLSWLPFGLGFLWSLFDAERLTWHDSGSRSRLLLIETRPVAHD